MVKSEWGLKRSCLSCGARFYDLGRSPIVCPKCGTVMEPEASIKVPRRSGVPVPPESKPVPVVAEEVAKGAAVEEDEDLEAAEADEDESTASTEAMDDGEEDDGDLIEDASDLGEDDDDMAEVMEHLDDNLEDEA